MTRPLLLAALSLTLAPALQAQEMLVEYWSNNCCLPPEFAWETEVTILTDGRLTLGHCTEYQTEGPGCTTTIASVPPEALEAIRAAVAEGGLVARPARKEDDPPVGGGATWAVVHLDGQAVELVAFPVAEDRERVNRVLGAIVAAIPQDLIPQTAD